MSTRRVAAGIVSYFPPKGPSEAWAAVAGSLIEDRVGVGGLTLGGGMGWLTRQARLSIDNLLSVQIVTADGRILRAAADENPDLFWAVRPSGARA
jgi:FAD/FMN-containing dehydrogenase